MIKHATVFGLLLIFTAGLSYASNHALESEGSLKETQTPSVESLGRVNDIESPYYMLCFYLVRDDDNSLVGTGYGRCPSMLSSGRTEANIYRHSALGEILTQAGIDSRRVQVLNYNNRQVFNAEQWIEQVADK